MKKFIHLKLNVNMEKKDKKIEYDYNIVSWLPVFPGFEGTELQINTDAVVEAHNRWLEKPIPKDKFIFDTMGYYSNMADSITEYVEAELEYFFAFCGATKDDFEMKFLRLYSPKEYDLDNDCIFVTYSFQQNVYDWIRQYIEDNYELFSDYIRYYYTKPRDAKVFTPYPNDPDVWLEDFDNLITNTNHGLGAVLDFILKNEGYNEEEMVRQMIPLMCKVEYDIVED